MRPKKEVLSHDSEWTVSELIDYLKGMDPNKKYIITLKTLIDPVESKKSWLTYNILKKRVTVKAKD